MLKRLFDGAGALAAVCVMLTFLVMIGAALGRTLGLRTGGTDDIVSWLCCASAFLALAHTFRHGDFVRMLLVIEGISPARRRVAEFGALTVALIFCSWATWWCVYSVWQSWAFREMSTGLIAIPIWIPQSPVALGIGLLCLAVFEQWFVVLRGVREPDYVTAVRARHAAGDFTSEV